MRTLQKKRLKQIISIENEQGLTTDKVLCEWGPQHCCIAGWSDSNNRATEIGYYSFQKITPDVIRSIFQTIRKTNSSAPVYFCSEFPEALLIPLKWGTQGAQLWQSFYSSNAPVLTDTVDQWQVVVAHAVPSLLLNEAEAQFSAAAFCHGFSNSLKVHNGFIANDSLSVHFTPYNFRVIARKDGQLFLAQMYPYQTPLDVVYYLLKICEEFNMPKDILYVVVSGLIEESSALYTELTNYFQTVQFAATPAIINHASYPPHYFTTLYNLSACAS